MALSVALSAALSSTETEDDSVEACAAARVAPVVFAREALIVEEAADESVAAWEAATAPWTATAAVALSVALPVAPSVALSSTDADAARLDA